MVRVEFKEPLSAQPNGFAIQTPPRIALDLPGVGNAMGKPKVEINQGNLRSANVAVFRRPRAPRPQSEGARQLHDPDPGQRAARRPRERACRAEPDRRRGRPGAVRADQNASALALRDIDFRRGQDGAGRVVVELPSNQVGVDIQQKGKTLVVDFLKSTLPDDTCAAVWT